MTVAAMSVRPENTATVLLVSPHAGPRLLPGLAEILARRGYCLMLAWSWRDAERLAYQRRPHAVVVDRGIGPDAPPGPRRDWTGPGRPPVLVVGSPTRLGAVVRAVCRLLPVPAPTRGAA